VQIIKKKDIKKISYSPWNHKHDIDISAIEKIELEKTKTKLLFENGKELSFKPFALQILSLDNREVLYA